MSIQNFIEEVKSAVSGRLPKAKAIKPRKIYKTPEQIWEEENRKVYKD